MHELFVRREGDTPVFYPNTPICGEIIVYDKKEDAIRSLSYVKSTYCVRLWRIASNQ